MTTADQKHIASLEAMIKRQHVEIERLQNELSELRAFIGESKLREFAVRPNTTK